MKHKLKIVRRLNRKEISCVAPFINDFNVWDIPEREWTTDVQKAVIHAYALGMKQALNEVYDQLHIIDDEAPDTNQIWED